MDPRRTDNSLLAGQRALVTGANTGVGAVIAQALYVARVIRARIEGRTPPGPFAYRHLGSLATIGRKAAVADFGWLHMSGALAWWLWGAVHIGFLVGLRNRISVMLDWFWAYLTFRSSTRLITGGEVQAQEPAAALMPQSPNVLSAPSRGSELRSSMVAERPFRLQILF